MKGSFPLVPSVFVYATVWGGLARQAGLSLGEIALMCLIVTAGGAPFVAAAEIAARLPPLPAPLAGAHRPRRQRRVLRPGCRAPEPTRPLVLSGERRGRVRIVHRRGPGRGRGPGAPPRPRPPPAGAAPP